jgi:hypothetical protein
MGEIFFKSEVVGAIQDSINFILADGVPLVANTYFKKNDGFFNLPINTW